MAQCINKLIFFHSIHISVICNIQSFRFVFHFPFSTGKKRVIGVDVLATFAVFSCIVSLESSSFIEREGGLLDEAFFDNLFETVGFITL